jgi:lysophospholipase L1-like esterase
MALASVLTTLTACSGVGVGALDAEASGPDAAALEASGPDAPATMPDSGVANPGEADAGAPRPTYLALGDSIAFGYNINHRTYLADGTSQELPDQAAHAIGYPEALANIIQRDARVRVGVANTACPGEASGSLVTGRHVDDNNCFENRHLYPLHYEYDHEDYDKRDGTESNKENYGSNVSQLANALAYLGDDPNHVKLVTLTAGANDALRFQNGACNWVQSLSDDACLAEGVLDAVLLKLQGNWEAMLTGLAKSGYTGPIVAVLYYSTGYRLQDLLVQAGIKILNAKIHDAAKAVLANYPTLNLKFVESFDVFQAGSSSFGDDPCRAGLTMMITDGPQKGECDVHPSNAGEEMLAAAVWSSLTLAEQQDLLKSGTN